MRFLNLRTLNLHIIAYYCFLIMKKYPRHASAPRKMCQKKQAHMIGITYGMLPSRTIAVSTLAQKKLMLLRDEIKPSVNDARFEKVRPVIPWYPEIFGCPWHPFKFPGCSCLNLYINTFCSIYLYISHFPGIDLSLQPGFGTFCVKPCSFWSGNT